MTVDYLFLLLSLAVRLMKDILPSLATPLDFQLLRLLQYPNQRNELIFCNGAIVDTQSGKIDSGLFLLRAALIAHSGLQKFANSFGGRFPIGSGGILPVGVSDVRENTY